MKVEIEKYKADFSGLYMPASKDGSLLCSQVKKGYTYYIFRTKEKSWIRHSGKLTKEEKSMVIKWEMQNESKTI